MSESPVRVKLLHPDAQVPSKATETSTGYDLYAYLPNGSASVGTEPDLIPTGIALEIEPGFDVQIRPRSGLSSKGIIVILGTIDADYRGELFVTMYTLGKSHKVRNGDRIAQLVVSRIMALGNMLTIDELSETARGAGGHGSTGR